MGRKSKYSKELKWSIVKRYLSDEGLYKSLVREINMTVNIADNWAKRYMVFSKNVIDTFSKNTSYTKDFKE